MTVWFPTGRLAPEHGAPAAADTAAAPPADSEAAPPGAARRGLAGAVLAGTLAGTLAAAAVVLAARTLLPPTPRALLAAEQQAHAMADLTEAQQALAQRLRTLETEGVAAARTEAALAADGRAVHGDIAAMQATLARLNAAAAEGSGRGRLAVVQLHDAVEAGRPFDWELVNVRGIVPPAPALLAALDRLAPLAAAGVPTGAQLAEGLRTLALIDDQRRALPLVGNGIELFGRALVPALLPAPDANPALLTRASALLDAGDMAGTLGALRRVDGATAETARPLVAGAEKRAAAEAAVRTLLDGARDGLRTQLRTAAAVGAGGQP
jgi:hypothetical protein